MSTFIDTSAFLALLAQNDPQHENAVKRYRTLLETPYSLVTTNYVVVESIALTQNRMGLEAVKTLLNDILPSVDVLWLDITLHAQAILTLLTANRRALSIVDCSSFVFMHSQNISNAFAYDAHFEEQGFKCLR